MKNRSVLGVLVVLALLLALVVSGAPAAKAASGHRIDVGYTILQGGYWKGSGSYNNYDGVYRAVCVGLWFTGVQGAVNLSVRCVGTPKGGGYAFSAPSVRCRNSPGYIWTKVEGFKHGSRSRDVKTSNRIGAHC
jgi:hypothetical protein